MVNRTCRDLYLKNPSIDTFTGHHSMKRYGKIIQVDRCIKQRDLFLS